jgi:hypothetical protein
MRLHLEHEAEEGKCEAVLHQRALRRRWIAHVFRVLVAESYLFSIGDSSSMDAPNCGGSFAG